MRPRPIWGAPAGARREQTPPRCPRARPRRHIEYVITSYSIHYTKLYECVAYHRAKGQVPGCFFSKAGEASYDRSVAESLHSDFWLRARRNRNVIIGGGIVLAIVLTAIFGPPLLSHDPNEVDMLSVWAAPDDRNNFV